MEKDVNKQNVVTIVGAAIKVSLVNNEDTLILMLPRPKRHGDIAYGLHLMRGIVKDTEEGFLTSEGNFVNRKDACAIAVEAKQTKTVEFYPVLYTEDLW